MGIRIIYKTLISSIMICFMLTPIISQAIQVSTLNKADQVSSLLSLNQISLCEMTNAEDTLILHIQEFFNKRNDMFLTGDIADLIPYYETSHNYGKYSLEHEVRRIRYLRDWAGERGIKFTSISSKANVKRASVSPTHAKIKVDEEYKFEYVYNCDNEPVVNNFGINLFHAITLNKKNDKWIITSDWYLDCFDDALKGYSWDFKTLQFSEPKSQCYDFSTFAPPTLQETGTPIPKGKYNRLKAIEYADKYCGVPWGSKNNLKYNKKYKNYTGIGGDCTNYISQCLGDKEGGALKHDGAWFSVYKKYDGAENSASWVNADAFRNYLLYSGKGTLIKRGSFKNLIAPSNDSPNGAIGRLQLGDVVSYAKGNDIDHNAIVTAFDSHGYPLINSHTVERYHVPFDLGWSDKNIYFHLIHVR
ncbi:exported protein [Clostridium polyendosporum]|uniref:Exported protein n=1 Tax=Clostridium polyendosporum TaxID=69208 RepID=A0A919S0C4_9CLOT|nr:amidase domain-containing protein [Clostridium polyendosporum]GIM29497.1 exported protein [Clostridium polyendosporum]